jgi:predicted SprT family Zn-dependent metalloprotease
MSDRIRTAPDVAFRPVGMGAAISFRCAACAQPKPTLGRRLKRVLGLRQYVCKGCAK